MSIKDIIKESQKNKPKGYNADVTKRRDYFHGQQISYLTGELSKRYPKSADMMFPTIMPIFRHLVNHMSKVYRVPPRRDYVGASSEEAKAIDELFARSMLNPHLQKAEKISAASGVCFLRVGWDEDFNRFDFSHFWPDQVEVKINEDYPRKLSRSHNVLLALANDRYENWEHLDNGTWQCTTWKKEDMIEDKGNFPFLPIIAIYFELPDQMFPQLCSDDIDAQSAINAMYTELLFTISMQAHSQMVFNGEEMPPDLVSGPGTVWKAGVNESFSSVDMNPKINDVTSAINDMLNRTMMLRGVSPMALSTEPVLASGIALKIQNLPMVEMREERLSLFRDVEENELFPLLRAVHNLYADSVIDENVQLRWFVGMMLAPSDDGVEMQLARQRIDMNISTPVKEMVRLGLAADLTDAERQYAEHRDVNALHVVADAQTDAVVIGIKGSADENNDA
jgi:hypothetical protein